MVMAKNWFEGELEDVAKALAAAVLPELVPALEKFGADLEKKLLAEMTVLLSRFHL
jgi:hypothetical protein